MSVEAEEDHVAINARAGIGLAAHVKKSLIAAGVVLLLCIPMVAFRTADAVGGLELIPRWGLVATLVAIAFVGQLGDQDYQVVDVNLFVDISAFIF
jgi:hypothetical protein